MIPNNSLHLRDTKHLGFKLGTIIPSWEAGIITEVPSGLKYIVSSPLDFIVFLRCTRTDGQKSAKKIIVIKPNVTIKVKQRNPS